MNAGDGTGLFGIYCETPSGGVEVKIVMSTGSINAPVEFGRLLRRLAELPYDSDDRLERVDPLPDDDK